VLILRSAWLLAGRSWHVLMEGAPEHLDVEEVKRALVGSVPSVLDVHHVHLWSLTPERPLVTLHARVAARADHEAVLHGLQRVLRERFDLDHATIQIEEGLCTDAVSPEKASAGPAAHEPGPSHRES
jgi:cobalt-zinc-cadmium efflux system protein